MMFDTTSGRSKSLYAIENTVTSTATFRTPIVAKLNSFATIVRLCHAAAIWFKARSMTECFTGRAQLSPYYFYDSSKEKTRLPVEDTIASVADDLEDQYNNPVRVIGFDAAQRTSRDVSKDVAR